MADRDRNERNDGGSAREGAQRSPRRSEIIEAQEDRREAASLSDAASYQAQPKRDMGQRANVTETGTAQRAEEAAGLDAHEHHYEDAERAAHESAGDRRPRERGQ